MRSFDRPLSAAERDAVSRRITVLEEQHRPLSELWLKARIVSVPVGVLWLATMLVSRAPWWVITVFWLITSALLIAVVSALMSRERRADLRSWREILSLDTAHVRIHVQSSRVVEMPDEFSEPRYAFELPGDEIALCMGPQFWPDELTDFPNSDFSVVELSDQRGRVMETVIAREGKKLEPERRLAAARLKPQTGCIVFAGKQFVVMKGKLDDIARLLGISETAR